MHNSRPKPRARLCTSKSIVRPATPCRCSAPTSDGAHLLLIHMARLATTLKTAQNITEVRAAATPFADLMEAYLTKLDAEEPTAKLPYAVKPGGEAAAFLEIETRAMAVADAFEEEEEEELHQKKSRDYGMGHLR